MSRFAHAQLTNIGGGEYAWSELEGNYYIYRRP